MSGEIIGIDDRTLRVIADDLIAYMETQALLEGRAAEGVADEEKEELAQQMREVAEHVKRLSEELMRKSEAVGYVLDRLENEAALIHSERERLKAKERACECAREWLRKYAASVMQQNGIKRIKTPTRTLFLRESESVEILDATQVPAKFQNAEVKLPLWLWDEIVETVEANASVAVCQQTRDLRVKAEPSRTAIHKAIKAGEDVEGADLQLNTHLVCR